MSDEELDALERQCFEAIKLIQQDYQKSIEPWVKKLATIREMRRVTVIVDGERLIPIPPAAPPESPA